MKDAEFLRWGIAGLGSGAMTLVGGFKRNPHVRITAAADIRREALEAFGREFEAETFDSVEAMCASPNVDAVWVATPNHLHAEHVMAAAEHRKHVTVSKPMALTLEECERMNAVAERNGIVLLCGHTQSMLAPIRKMAELVASGELGKLAMVHTLHYTDWIYRPRMPYELDVAQGGGAVFRQSPHQIDIVRLIGGGLVKSVRASLLQIDPARPAPGGYVVFLQFVDGATATIVYNGYGFFDMGELTMPRQFSPGRVAASTTPEEEWAMKEARRYGSGRSGADEDRQQERGLSAFGLTIATCERGDVRQSPDGLYVYETSGRREIHVEPDRHRGTAEFEEMYQAVVHGHRPVHDGRWGEATHEVTLAIMESSRSGKEIALSHQVGLPV